SIRAGAQSRPRSETSLTTDDRLQSPAWWPTKGAAAPHDFGGTGECTKFHWTEPATQLTPPMARASTPAPNAEILRDHDRLARDLPPYHYEIARTESGSSYSVSDGTNTISEPLAWAFGIAHKGQTYI